MEVFYYYRFNSSVCVQYVLYVLKDCQKMAVLFHYSDANASVPLSLIGLLFNYEIEINSQLMCILYTCGL